LLTLLRSEGETDATESHKSEGFLKSLWHKVHPVHADDGTTTSSTSEEKAKDDTVKDDVKDKEPDDPKKGSGL
jgi:molecular chaperone DnaJ